MSEISNYRLRLEATTLAPLVKTNRPYKLLVTLLLLLVAWGFYAWVTQLRHGLIVTGLNNRVSWGFYITNFVFFVGISHAGTLLSAILRVTDTEWRLPITRMAEVITVVALFVGASMIVIDMGRPDRILNLIFYGQIRSPLIWDLISVTTYLVGSITFLYLPLIPDIALCRDRLESSASSFKKWVYRVFSLGWRGTESQKKRLEKAMGIMSVAIIPVAISVHTIISWIFGMTLRPGWNSTIFGPYFVIGAIFSGIASILIVMAIFRKVFRLYDYITKEHFIKLGWLFLLLTALYAYFTFSEYLTVGYKLEGPERELMHLLLLGEQAPLFWAFAIGGVLIPALIMVFPRTRTITGLVTAAVLVDIGMWLKRFIIIVPSLQVPLMPFDFAHYRPTWIEWSITIGGFAGFTLLFALFAKLFPIISVWEVADAHEETEYRGKTRTEAEASSSRKVQEAQYGGVNS